MTQRQAVLSPPMQPLRLPAMVSFFCALSHKFLFFLSLGQATHRLRASTGVACDSAQTLAKVPPITAYIKGNPTID